MRPMIRNGLAGALAATTLLVTACGDQSLAPPPLPADDALYWDLALDHQSVLMSTTAPYDMLRVTATPLNVFGKPLAGAFAPIFTSNDPSKVAVTTDGQIIALAPANQPITITATLTIANMRRRRDVLVMVVDANQPLVLSKFSIHPEPSESAKVALSTQNTTTLGTVPLHVLDANGAPVPVYGRDDAGLLPVTFVSIDTTSLSVQRSSGATIGGRVGMTRVAAGATVFGVGYADTIDYRVGNPLLMQAAITVAAPHSLTPTTSYYLAAPEIRIAAGGAVGWAFAVDPATTTDTIAVTFADADLPNVQPVQPVIDQLMALGGMTSFTLCGVFGICSTTGGSFILVPGFLSNIQGRYFPVPGTYPYTVTSTGGTGNPITGRVVVVDERATP